MLVVTPSETSISHLHKPLLKGFELKYKGKRMNGGIQCKN